MDNDLTLTSVVFEYVIWCKWYFVMNNLTLTSVVFELDIYIISFTNFYI